LKKLTTRQKWKQYLAARQRYEHKKTARFNDYQRRKNAESVLDRPAKRFRHSANIQAPNVLSFIEDPAATVHFLNRLRALAKVKDVFVDLSNVQRVTTDAIAGLLATIYHSGADNSRITGNIPVATAARSILEASGFREHVRSASYWSPTPGATGKVRKRTLTGDTVETRYSQKVANELVNFAVEKLTGETGRHGPSYATLGEAMLNTLNHAARASEPEPWWASVYIDNGRKCACFTFIDQGVGIFRSHNLNTFLKLQKSFSILDNADILKKILQGEVRSSTGVPGRGNGLPGMYNHCKAGRIRNLTVLANDAIGHAENDRFESLGSPFHGTLIYWEVSYDDSYAN
jgi:hypothetical protein